MVSHRVTAAASEFLQLYPNSFKGRSTKDIIDKVRTAINRPQHMVNNDGTAKGLRTTFVSVASTRHQWEMIMQAVLQNHEDFYKKYDGTFSFELRLSHIFSP